ncbi:hypothetical protein SAMN05443545_103124 [Aidingimonas halophila]|uniref:Uncharacterized protein n=1 Tax=Aidingimonas halophila TaxID=574349 RepID=A0A1H2X7M5_9GAMM|nr:hypothetical protein SAMN05443545_103124 [Aidingimonas halophila]
MRQPGGQRGVKRSSDLNRVSGPWHASVAVVDQVGVTPLRPIMKRLPQRIQHHVGAGRAGDSPADEPAGEGIRFRVEEAGRSRTISLLLLSEPSVHLSAHTALHSSVAQNQGNVQVMVSLAAPERPSPVRRPEPRAD